MAVAPLKVVPTELLMALAAEAPKPKPAAPPPRAFRAATSGFDDEKRVRRCRKYLEKVCPAVSGEGGSDQTFKAARIIWNDFGIDEPDAWSLLVEFNQSCQPQWEDHLLRKKLSDAMAKGPGPEGRGYKFAASRKGAAGSDTRGGNSRNGTPSASASPNAEPPPPENDAPAATGGGQLPQIKVNDRQYRDVEYDANEALVAANNPPTVFVGNGGALIEVRQPRAEEPPSTHTLTSSAMRSVFGRSADWFEERETPKGEIVTKQVFPPKALLESYPVRGCWPGMPHLESLVTYPVFDRNWNLVASDGYHESGRVYCHLGNLIVPPIPMSPTPQQVKTAKDFILTELLGDFPFADEASRDNALAMLILPTVRNVIDGPTPLAVIDAPAEGTGKSLLTEMCLLAITGEIPEAMESDHKPEEWAKTLMSLLVEGHPIVFLDNANHAIDSGSLASVLTARYRRGRMLQYTMTVRAKVNVCWILTGNNITVSREIARRSYWIRLDAGVETPANRKGFRHPDLDAWVRENRGRIIAAVATLVQNWIAAGRPAGSVTLGKFERWAATVGGILEAAGITGLMGNADQFRKRSSSGAAEAAEFVTAWWDHFGSLPSMTKDLFEFAKNGDHLESTLFAPSDEGKRRQLGKWLSRQRDRVIAGYRIHVEEKKDYAGRPRYRLEPVSGESTPAAERDSGATDSDATFEMSG